MISVEEAKKIIATNTKTLKPVKVPLRHAAGKVLAENVYAATDVPPFPQSSMDGYAFSFGDWKSNKTLIVEGKIAAGSNEQISLALGKAVRIFTGAPVPPGADTVVMQEKARIDSPVGSQNELIIEDQNLKQGINVRPKGSEIKKGEPALDQYTFLSPAAIGFIAGIGVAEVHVFPNPSISIIITGKELQQTGNPLSYGQVYESNSCILTAVLEDLHIESVKIFRADDDLEILTDILAEALQNSDMVLLSGGISAGDYDFVLQAATNCGVTQLFHKIKQRPGKPLFFGKKENKLVFGLPGNPSSVLTCFYEYVLAALEILTKRKISLQSVQAPLSQPFLKPAGLTHFLKGFYNGSTVSVLNAQESFRLSSFAKANCLVKINEEVMECNEGEMVDVHLLPGYFL
ncbi:MAG: molybdopterin molybdotransferase MoeA [Bacteroidota bacterium]|nr:molybdopterin molybdotransferase MoeA [Bacteroidota bacterium]